MTDRLTPVTLAERQAPVVPAGAPGAAPAGEAPPGHRSAPSGTTVPPSDPTAVLSWGVGIAVAAASGVLLDAAFPDRGWWAAAPIAIAALHLTLIGRRAGGGFVLGAVAGLTFWLSQLSWLTTYLGPVPWLALGTMQAGFIAIAAAMTAVLYRAADRAWTPTARMIFIPLTAAGIWTGRELISGSWPYGGFGWGRIASSQVDGPFADLLPWLGAGGTTFVVVWVAVLTVELFRTRPGSRMSGAAVIVVALTTLVAIPAWTPVPAGSLRVAAVQGGVDASLFSSAVPGDVLRAHEAATEGIGPVDLVIWPENASDLDPSRSADAVAALNRVAGGAPLMVGTITMRENEMVNTSLLWEPGAGVTDWYDKARPVPFGEYVPDRAFWRQFAPDLIDLITRDYTPGTRENLFEVAGTRIGVGICFDVVDDGLVGQMARGGAELLVYQSNNADFGRTDQSAQQLALARMRALETGRTVVNVSTVATTAIIQPDGAVTEQLPTWEAGAIVADVSLNTGTTPATIIGAQLFGILAAVGALGLIAALFGAARSSRRGG